MPQSLPPLNWFRAFESAARHLSFTQAAQELALTQPAVSQQIKLLEMRLGVLLFVRRARGIALTDDGRRLLPSVEAALQTLKSATAQYDQATGNPVITVSVSFSLMQWLISPHLYSFRVTHPDVQLRFVTNVWPDEMRQAIADVVIGFSTRNQAPEGAILLQPNRLLALKAPDYPHPIHQSQLIETEGTSDGWAAWANGAGLENMRPTLFADSHGMAMQLAVDGAGLCLVSEVLAMRALDQGLLARAHDHAIDANEGFYLSTPGNSPFASAFADWLVNQATSSAPL